MDSEVLMKQRDGFTLVEIIVALMLLATAVVGMQMTIVSMLRFTTRSQTSLTAVHLAEDRLDVIRLQPNYQTLTSFVGTEASIPGSPGYQRITSMTHTRDSTAAGITDYQRVTVEVRAPWLAAPVVRTLIIGAP
jgi:prepilin-type N-terminal cleavage/methylation domain-containing protein